MLGLRPYLLRNQPALTEAQKKKRVAFAKANKHTDWSQAVFEDEKKFTIGTPNRKNRVVYATSRDKVPTISTYKYHAKINVAGAISTNGRTDLHLFKETMDAPLFKDILDETILPDASPLYPGGSFKLYMDSDPKHTAKMITNHLD